MLLCMDVHKGFLSGWSDYFSIRSVAIISFFYG